MKYEEKRQNERMKAGRRALWRKAEKVI